MSEIRRFNQIRTSSGTHTQSAAITRPKAPLAAPGASQSSGCTCRQRHSLVHEHALSPPSESERASQKARPEFVDREIFGPLFFGPEQTKLRPKKFITILSLVCSGPTSRGPHPAASSKAGFEGTRRHETLRSWILRHVALHRRQNLRRQECLAAARAAGTVAVGQTGCLTDAGDAGRQGREAELRRRATHSAPGMHEAWAPWLPSAHTRGTAT